MYFFGVELSKNAKCLILHGKVASLIRRGGLSLHCQLHITF